MRREPKISYKNDSDRQQAADEFANLKNHPAWKRIIKYYDKKIEWLQAVINGDIKNDDGSNIIQTTEQLELWRAKRNMAIQFRNLPDILTEIEILSTGRIPDIDPYE